jgi:hypothetical protein
MSGVKRIAETTESFAKGRGVREPLMFDLGIASNVNADEVLQTINCQIEAFRSTR